MGDDTDFREDDSEGMEEHDEGKRLIGKSEEVKEDRDQETGNKHINKNSIVNNLSYNGDWIKKLMK